MSMGIRLGLVIFIHFLSPFYFGLFWSLAEPAGNAEIIWLFFLFVDPG